MTKKPYVATVSDTYEYCYIEDGRSVEHKVKVWYDYQPREPRTLNYPGCDAELDITSVHTLTTIDVTNNNGLVYDYEACDVELLEWLNKETLELIEQQVWDKIEERSEEDVFG